MGDLISKEALLRTMTNQCSTDCNICSYFECGHCELIALAPPVPAIVIPENEPKNKDIIKLVFGKKVARMMERFAWVHYQSKWFNAPYKQQKEKPIGTQFREALEQRRDSNDN